MCDASNELQSSSTYSNAAVVFDATIVGVRDVNDFRFYGLIAGPGISILETATTVTVIDEPTVGVIGMFMNMGADLVYGVPISYVPQLDSTGLGQYNNGLYAAGIITPQVSGSHTLSWLVSFMSTNINVIVEYLDGTLIANSPYRFDDRTRPTSVGSTRTLDLVGGVPIRLRIVSTSPGTLLLSNSYITVST
jgi:hypothetical protein